MHEEEKGHKEEKETGREKEREKKKNFATYGVLLTTNQQTVGDWGRGRQVGSNQS